MEVQRSHLTVCLVTDGRGDAAGMLARIEAGVRAGVDLIQVREPQLQDRALIDLTRRACETARGGSTRVLVNERLDVALAAGADGLHLRGSSFSAARVRTQQPVPFLVGRSVHQLDEALAVERDGGCDYLVFGTVFESRGKSRGHRVAGLDALRQVCSGVRLPVIAIGGITRDCVAEIRDAGAAGIAGISLFADLDAMRSTVEFARRSFDT